MAVLSETLNLSRIVKPITPHVGASANINISNRYMSVTGAFGIGAFGFMVWSGWNFCNKKPCVRQLLTAVGFGVAYGALDYKDNVLYSKKTKTESSNSSDSSISWCF